MEQPETIYFFVYGSLRSGFHHPAYAYVSPYFVLLGDASVKGSLFDLGTYAAAVPAENDTLLHGELYKLKNEEEFAWVFGQLDDYEGLHTEPGEKPLYRRSITEVQCGDAVYNAWIYWYNGEINNQPLVASGDMLQYLHQKNQSS